MEIITKNERETFEFAKNYARTLTGGEILLLGGDLGAGKTVFTKGLAVGLGIDDDVTSPTFTIMNEYYGTLTLCHVDAYRLKSGEEAYMAGLTEYFGQEDTVCCIEWWQNIVSAIAGKQIRIQIEYLGDEERKITINEQ